LDRLETPSAAAASSTRSKVLGCLGLILAVVLLCPVITVMVFTALILVDYFEEIQDSLKFDIIDSMILLGAVACCAVVLLIGASRLKKKQRERTEHPEG
jgi:hypothetical protein